MKDNPKAKAIRSWSAKGEMEHESSQFAKKIRSRVKRGLPPPSIPTK